MWQKGNVGPMFGQANHFTRYAPGGDSLRQGALRQRAPAALRRDRAASLRGAPSWPATHYSIADIASFPWTRNHANHDIDLDAHPNFKRWFDEISARPAVERGLEVLSDLPPRELDEKARDILFGATQYARR